MTRVAMAVNAIIKNHCLQELENAAIPGISQLAVSMLATYRIDRVSVERLMGFVSALRQDVSITISHQRATAGYISVVEAG